MVVLRSLLLLPYIQISIKTIGLKRTQRFLSSLCMTPVPQSRNGLESGRRIANYTYLVNNRFSILGECLARSLTIWFQLRRLGIDSDLKFGTKKENGQLLAHAWIEFEGEVLASKNEQNEGYVFFNESIIGEYSE
jgi:hypothetical protein